MIKQTDLFFFWKNVAVAAVTFAVLSDYLLYPYCFIVKFIHATDFNCIYIFISYLSVILIFLLRPQLVVKTKYIDINKAFSLLTVHCG